MTKNKYSLKILILLTFMLQPASATMDYILTYYIPVASELDSNLTVKDGMRLHKAMVYTYYSEPESAISSITKKYTIYTPHIGKESAYMRDYDVNLANIKGLNVELLDYGSKECRVVMDSSKVVSTYSPEVLEKVLKYVKKATKLNMKEHKINCAFKEITASKVVKPSTLPKALNIEKSAFMALDKYTSGVAHAPFIYSIFYPLGYSDDGKIAYIEEYDTTPAALVSITTYVQDLVTDKIIWKDEYNLDTPIGKNDIEDFWKKKKNSIGQKLNTYGIKPFNRAQFFSKNYFYKNQNFSLTSSDTSSFHKDWGMKFLDNSVIRLGTKNLGMKTIDSHVYKDEHLIARKAIGFIPLGKSDRVAVVVANVHRGWEGPPHNLSYDIVGASLKVGFK